MAKWPDAAEYVGQRFAFLTATEVVDGYRLRCTCDCGVKVVTTKYMLAKGEKKSCGCATSEMRAVGGKSQAGRARRKRDPKDRFWEKVEKLPGDNCWLWRSFVMPNGYGQFGVSGKGMRYAHRVSYEMNVGPIPAGMIVCHRCDVRNCVRPDHLFIGTHQDNSADMMNKGRGRVGERNPRAKICADTVLAIRAAEGSCRQIGERFGLSTMQVNRIRRRKLWRHVAEVPSNV